MALPNFVCVGAEKAGTSPLFDLMNRHPEICIPPHKETHFFSRWSEIGSLINYEASFQNYCGQRAIGELTPDYLRVPHLAKKMRSMLGEIKIIVCLREPVRRAFSHYHQCLRILQENRSFEQAYRADAGLDAQSSYLTMRTAYVTGSRYPDQIRSFADAFGKENMFYFLLERDLATRESTLDMLRRLFRFLGVASNVTGLTSVADTRLPCPSVRFIQSRQEVLVGKTRTAAEPGDILFITGNPGLDRLVRRPSENARQFFTAMMRNMTPKLSSDAADQLRAERFKGLEEELSDLVGFDVSTYWNTTKRPESNWDEGMRVAQPASDRSSLTEAGCQSERDRLHQWPRQRPL